MKKILTILSGILLMSLFSCSSEPAETTLPTEADGGISPFIDYPLLRHYIQYFDERGLSTTARPSTADQLRLHKTVFTAAVSRWMTEGNYGSNDVAIGVYNSLYAHNTLKYGASTRSLDAVETNVENEVLFAGIVPAYMLPDVYILGEGDMYRRFMEAVASDENIFNMTSSLLLTASVANLSPQITGQAFAGREAREIQYDMEDFDELLRPCWEMSNFSISSAMTRFKQTVGATGVDADALDLLAFCLEGILANDAAQSKSIAYDLIGWSDTALVEQYFPNPQDVEDLLVAISTGAYAHIFWSADRTPLYAEIGAIEDQKFDFPKFEIDITANTTWTIRPVSNTAFVTFDAISGNGDTVIAAECDINQGASQRIARFELQYESRTGTETVPFEIRQDPPTGKYAVLADKGWTVSAAGGTVQIPVYSNTTWQIARIFTLAKYAFYNCTANVSSGNGTLTVTFDPNYTGEARAGSPGIEYDIESPVIIGGVVRKPMTSVIVTQPSGGDPEFSVSPKGYTFTGNGGSYTFKITSNQYWKVEELLPSILKPFHVEEKTGWGDGEFKVSAERFLSQTPNVMRLTDIKITYNSYKYLGGWGDDDLPFQILRVSQTPILW